MSILGKIKRAIFGESGPLGGQFGGGSILGSGKTAQPNTPAQTTQAEPSAMPQMQQRQAQQPPQVQSPAAQPVDVEAVLEGISAQKGHPNLNWRTSIVDLMKLLDLDSSLDNRRELATELGYTGEKNGSAEMNIWLHKALMRELEKSGGKVPASLKD
ncbi:DUF3597 domain-containing protein [Sphingomonas lenta]|uniref:DUF3597 domain-containing protein n=1 Tax=Sphingomonas lenta TaxID=1141887 RepID=A0A2A2SGA4_9SPHN|nr:DUF3597 domain-containing protein [Sphingomonas lenta]PAX08220.1 hypothetical protein CKY28_11675 [Sphingomonas lenta]